MWKQRNYTTSTRIAFIHHIQWAQMRWPASLDAHSYFMYTCLPPKENSNNDNEIM